MKRMGQYARAVNPRLYAATPKAVFAALAASLPLNGGASVPEGDTPDAYIAREWCLLHSQGLVESAPPAWVREMVQG